MRYGILFDPSTKNSICRNIGNLSSGLRSTGWFVENLCLRTRNEK